MWLDYGYKPEEATRMLEDGELIEQAGLEQVKTMLTYCVRGEKSCDGHRESLLEDGR